MKSGQTSYYDYQSDFINVNGDHFRIDESFLGQYKGQRPNFGYNGLGEFVFYRTYSRLKPDNKKESFIDVLKRVVEGCYEIQRRHCRKIHVPWDYNKAQSSAQEMFERMWQFKFLPPGRGLWCMGTQFMWERGGAALNNCFAGETEIITRDGIKRINDVVGTTQTLLTIGGKWVEAPIKSFGMQKLSKITLQRRNVQHVIYATADHRWFVKDKRTIDSEVVLAGTRQEQSAIRLEKLKSIKHAGYKEITTSQLDINHRLRLVFGCGINGNVRPSVFGIAHGICFGDGTLGHDSESTSSYLYLVGQKNAELLKYFGPSHTSFDSSKGKDGAIRVADIPRAFKRPPNLRESRSYLYGWLAGYFAADGRIGNKGTSASICSSKYENILLVRDVCAILGIGTYSINKQFKKIRHDDGRITEHIGYSLNMMLAHLRPEFFLLQEHRRRFEFWESKRKSRIFDWDIVSVEETNRFEEVYCAQVPKHHAFTLAGNILTGNCAFVSTQDIANNTSEPFCFLMDMSLLGVGVGFDTRGKNTTKVQKPLLFHTDYKIEDSREGWVESTRLIIDSFTSNPKIGDLSFDYSAIRPAGTPIRGFGGFASGPGVLMELHNKLRTFFGTRIGSLLNARDIVDVMNMIGATVVAGNVRRSSEISFGEHDDKDYTEMKDYTKYPDECRAWRWVSNNSVLASVGMDYREIAKQTSLNGEPGYVWLENMRDFGRLIDGKQPGIDGRVMGANPCSEQSLESHELCCLVETFPYMHDNADDYLRTLKSAYLYAKSVTLLSTHNARTNSVMLRNRRIGLSQSGIVQAFEKFGRRAVLHDFCDAGYHEVRRWDKIYSEWLCIPQSIKITSVKPSGSVSLLVGATPGIHYPEARWYWRRVRISRTSLLVKILMDAGYDVELSITDPETVVVKFASGDDIRPVSEVSIWEQTVNVVDYQTYWCDNQPSVTIKFKPEEADQVPLILQAFEDRLKAISFLPHVNHGYAQAPYEPTTKDEVDAYNAKLKPINFSSWIGEDADAAAVKFCDGDTCSVDLEALGKINTAEVCSSS